MQRYFVAKYIEKWEMRANRNLCLLKYCYPEGMKRNTGIALIYSSNGKQKNERNAVDCNLVIEIKLDQYIRESERDPRYSSCMLISFPAINRSNA